MKFRIGKCGSFYYCLGQDVNYISGIVWNTSFREFGKFSNSSEFMEEQYQVQ